MFLDAADGSIGLDQAFRARIPLTHVDGRQVTFAVDGRLEFQMLAAVVGASVRLLLLLLLFHRPSQSELVVFIAFVVVGDGDDFGFFGAGTTDGSGSGVVHFVDDLDVLVQVVKIPWREVKVKQIVSGQYESIEINADSMML